MIATPELRLRETAGNRKVEISYIGGYPIRDPFLSGDRSLAGTLEINTTDVRHQIRRRDP